MRNKYAANHVLLRDGVFYYVRRVPLDLAEHYSVKRLCFSLRTKSYKSAVHASKSVSQRLEDYWLGLRLQKIDIPALDLVKSDDLSDYSFLLSEARELYLRLKAIGKDKVFIRTATRNTNFATLDTKRTNANSVRGHSGGLTHPVKQANRSAGGHHHANVAPDARYELAPPRNNRQ